MPNLARQLREQVLAEHPQAQVVERGPNTLRHHIGENTFVLQAAIRPLHYEDSLGIHEIDTDWADDTGEQGVISVPYRHLFDKQGKRVFVPRPEFPNETITFSTPKVLGNNRRWTNLSISNKLRRGDVMEFSGGSFSLEVKNTSEGSKVNFIAYDPAIVRPIRWDVTLSGVVRNDNQFISQSDGTVVAEYPEFTMEDVDGTVRVVDSVVTDIALELHPDTTGLVFPVTIDPTIQKTHPTYAGETTFVYYRGDGGATGMAITNNTGWLAGRYYGSYGRVEDGSIRYQGMSELRGATINSASFYFEQESNNTASGTAYVYLNKVASPTVPTSVTDFESKTRTTSYASQTIASTWVQNSFYTSVSLVSPLQELVNAFPTTLTDIQFIIRSATRTHLTSAATIRWYTQNCVLNINYTSNNTAPTISSAPTVSYNSFTRLGPNNTPATVTFTATDPEETGADALSYTIRTAASGGGTLVGSGTCTSGISKQHSIANSDSGLVDGSQTLYLRIYDGTAYSADSSFTLLRDTVAPSLSAITTLPNPVVGENG